MTSEQGNDKLCGPLEVGRNDTMTLSNSDSTDDINKAETKFVFLASEKAVKSKTLLFSVDKEQGKINMDSKVNSQSSSQLKNNLVNALGQPVYILKPVTCMKNSEIVKPRSIPKKVGHVINAPGKNNLIEGEPKICSSGKPIGRSKSLEATIDIRKPLLKSSTVAVTPEVKVEAEAAVVKITADNNMKPNRPFPLPSITQLNEQTGTLKNLLRPEKVEVCKKVQKQTEKYGFEKILTSTKGAGKSLADKNKEYLGQQISINGVSGNQDLNIPKMVKQNSFGHLIDTMDCGSSVDKGRVIKTLPGTSLEYRTPGATNLNRNGNVKRPMNAFMCWARTARQQICSSMPYASNADVSIQLGNVWSALSAEQKRPFYEEAEQIKRAHREQHPDWTYKPQPKRRRNEEAYSGPSLYRKWKQEQADRRSKETKGTGGIGGSMGTDKVGVIKSNMSPLQYRFVASSSAPAGGTVQCAGDTVKGRPPSSSIRTTCLLLTTSVDTPVVLPKSSTTSVAVNTSLATTSSVSQQTIATEQSPLDLTINQEERESYGDLTQVSNEVEVGTGAAEQPVDNSVQYVVQHPEAVGIPTKMQDNLQISAEVEVATHEIKTENSNKPEAAVLQSYIDTKCQDFTSNVFSEAATKPNHQDVCCVKDTSGQQVTGSIIENQNNRGLVCTGDSVDGNNNFKSFPVERNDAYQVVNQATIQPVQTSCAQNLNNSDFNGRRQTNFIPVPRPDIQPKRKVQKSNWADVSTLIDSNTDAEVSEEKQAQVVSHSTDIHNGSGGMVVEYAKDVNGATNVGPTSIPCMYEQRYFIQNHPTVEAKDTMQTVEDDSVENPQNMEPAPSSNEVNNQTRSDSMPQVKTVQPTANNSENSIHQDCKKSLYPTQQQYHILPMSTQNNATVNSDIQPQTQSVPVNSQNNIKSQPCQLYCQERQGYEIPHHREMTTDAPILSGTTWNPNLPQVHACSGRYPGFVGNNSAASLASWWRFPFSRYPYDDHLREQAAAANLKGEPFQPLPVTHAPQYGIRDLADYDEDIPTSPPSVTQYDMATARWFQPATPNTSIPQLELNRWISYMNDDSSPPAVCSEGERQRFRAFLQDTQPSCPMHGVCSKKDLYSQQTQQAQQHWSAAPPQ